ncbi:hypothetical protein BP00DRAFT_421486, partial [Aspergillus indologenus CBS 114.80]
MALIHVLVATGVAMVGAGAGGLLGDTPKPSDLSNIKVGMVLLEVAWGVLALWGLWTRWGGRGSGWKSGDAPAGLARREGWLLLTGALLALPLVEVSVIYMLVAQFTQRADLNPMTGGLAVRVVLGFLPELLAAMVLVGVGIVTRKVGNAGAGAGEAGLRHGHGHGQGHGRRHRHAHAHGHGRRRSSSKHGRRLHSRSH